MIENHLTTLVSLPLIALNIENSQANDLAQTFSIFRSQITMRSFCSCIPICEICSLRSSPQRTLVYLSGHETPRKLQGSVLSCLNGIILSSAVNRSTFTLRSVCPWIPVSQSRWFFMKMNWYTLKQFKFCCVASRSRGVQPAFFVWSCSCEHISVWLGMQASRTCLQRGEQTWSTI